MKNIIIALLFLIVSPYAHAGALSQTSEFRMFIRTFFAHKEYQIEHIKYPLEKIHFKNGDFEEGLITSYIEKDKWQHLSGPKYYQCKTNCYDLIIYDNFEKKHKESNIRVLSFEGVENGINSSMYFKKINGAWFLVKYEAIST